MDEKCSECSATGVCTQCYTGYKLGALGCECATITNCKICTKSTDCNECYSGIYIIFINIIFNFINYNKILYKLNLNY
jgi:hypothetical protein